MGAAGGGGGLECGVRGSSSLGRTFPTFVPFYDGHARALFRIQEGILEGVGGVEAFALPTNRAGALQPLTGPCSK